MAGASRCCNHVIAVLYEVEYANANNLLSCLHIYTMWLEQINEKNHRTEKDKWDFCMKKDEIKHER